MEVASITYSQTVYSGICRLITYCTFDLHTKYLLKQNEAVISWKTAMDLSQKLVNNSKMLQIALLDFVQIKLKKKKFVS